MLFDGWELSKALTAGTTPDLYRTKGTFEVALNAIRREVDGLDADKPEYLDFMCPWRSGVLEASTQTAVQFGTAEYKVVPVMPQELFDDASGGTLIKAIWRCLGISADELRVSKDTNAVKELISISERLMKVDASVAHTNRLLANRKNWSTGKLPSVSLTPAEAAASGCLLAVGDVLLMSDLSYAFMVTGEVTSMEDGDDSYLLANCLWGGLRTKDDKEYIQARPVDLVWEDGKVLTMEGDRVETILRTSLMVRQALALLPPTWREGLPDDEDLCQVGSPSQALSLEQAQRYTQGSLAEKMLAGAPQVPAGGYGPYSGSNVQFGIAGFRGEAGARYPGMWGEGTLWIRPR